MKCYSLFDVIPCLQVCAEMQSMGTTFQKAGTALAAWNPVQWKAIAR